MRKRQVYRAPLARQQAVAHREHLYRDVRSPRIYEGASEIQRSIIARNLIGRDHTG